MGCERSILAKESHTGGRNSASGLNGYNALTDLPSYFLEETVAAYPEAKFILTTRDPDSWLRSYQNTLRVKIENGDRFPNDVMAFFDSYHRAIVRVTKLFAHFIWNGKSLDDDDAALETFIRQ
ncbi:hypothetical protein MKZ38_006575 [Zalerion maritima]|uniref:Sulfotransferase n=1 Tax=Zalerion maritima TaxID=339359 RepID=A0AAD5RIT8_9PEZI|nr:hypothetical protein MKZ38_006575 [Zalerion maritima]